MRIQGLAGFSCLLVLLAGFFTGLHVAWESVDGLAFPESHAERFMRYPLYCVEWMRDLPAEVWAWLSGESPLPPRFSPPGTLNYPPLTFLVSGLAILLFGQKVLVMRLAQLFFVFGLIALLARIGWRVAGMRGGILLALGITTATWTSEYTRIYTQDLGQMFFLALLVALLLEPEGLRRPRVCLALGVAFGLGMLTKYYFLLMGAPLVLLAAASGLLASRTSVLGGLGFVVMSGQLLWAARSGMRSAEANLGQVNAEGLPLFSWLPHVLGAELILLSGLLLACLLARGHRRLPAGVGLLAVASIAGLICAPWYFARLELWFWVMGVHTHAVPAAMQEGTWFSVLLWVLSNGLNVLDSFYWGGRYWLLSGSVLLWTWHERRQSARFLLAGSGVILGLNVLLLLPDPRYQAPMTPLLVVLAFLGMARNRAAWILCMLFMVCAGTLQMAGWLPAVGRVAAAVGLELRPISEICPHAMPVPFDVPRQPLRVVPVAEPPTWSMGILDAIPAGSRVGFLALTVPQGRPIPVLFRAWWTHLGEVVELDPSSETSLSDLDHVLVIAWDSPPPPLDMGQEPKRFRVFFKDLCRDRPELEVRDIHFHLYACRESTGALGPLGSSWVSGETRGASGHPELGEDPSALPKHAVTLLEAGTESRSLSERVRALPEFRGRQGRLVFQSGRRLQEVRLLTVGGSKLRVGGGQVVLGQILMDGRPVRVHFVVLPDEAGTPEINTIEVPDRAVTVPYRWSEARQVWLAGHAEPNLE